MKNVILLLRLNSKLGRKDSGKYDLLSTIFTVMIFGLVISFAILFFINLIVNFEKVGAEFQLLVFLLFFVLCIQILFGTVLCLKVFYNSAQSELLATMPITHRQIFLSRLVYAFILEFVFGLAMLLPLLNIYGILLNLSMSFFVIVPFAALISNLLAYLIGAVFSFPCAYLKSFLSNKFLLTLIIMTVVFMAAFFGYMQIINGVVSISNSINFKINNAIIDSIAKMAAVMYPNIFISNLLYFERVIVSLLLLIAMIAGVGLVLFGLVELIYEKMLIKRIGDARTYEGGIRKNKPKKIYISLLYREFVTIFRNSGYLFQYFSLLLVTPLITYLCVESSSAIAIGQMGNIAQNAIALFVMSLFSVIGSSFSAGAISREGEAIFLLKIMPLKPQVIVTSKLLFCCISVFGSLLISSVVLTIAGLVSFLNMLFIFFVSLAFSVGNAALALEFDLRSPGLADSKGIANPEKNSALSITAGFLSAILLGFLALLSDIFDLKILLGFVLAALVTAYAAGLCILVYKSADKKLSKITY